MSRGSKEILEGMYSPIHPFSRQCTDTSALLHSGSILSRNNLHNSSHQTLLNSAQCSENHAKKVVIKDWEEGGDGDESNSMKEPFEAFISGRASWGNILATCILPHSSFCKGTVSPLALCDPIGSFCRPKCSLCFLFSFSRVDFNKNNISYIFHHCC